jgi:hypothetical protein
MNGIELKRILKTVFLVYSTCYRDILLGGIREPTAIIHWIADAEYEV